MDTPMAVYPSFYLWTWAAENDDKLRGFCVPEFADLSRNWLSTGLYPNDSE